MTPSRWSALLLLPALVTACGTQAPARPPSPPAAASYALPFGLEQVPGSRPVGRPASYEDVLFVYDGVPVTGRRLQAAYLVEGDAVAVFRGWVEQLGDLPLERVGVNPGDGRTAQWLVASGEAAYDPATPPAASAFLQLWSTEAGPVLLVDVSVVRPEDAQRPVVEPVPDAPEPDEQVSDALAAAGGTVFTEQGDTVRVPQGAQEVLASIPVPAGTGGSSTVLTADDGAAAVAAMLDEAASYEAQAERTGPTATVEDGVRVVRGSFTIPAGGWTFSAVSVQAEDDPVATVYVTSGAD